MKPILTQENLTPAPHWQRARRGMVLAGLLVVLTGWLIFTPEGLWGKLIGIGYAVCHQSPNHSYFIGNLSLPLCARCTGMYLGVLTAGLYQLRFGRRQAFPKKKILFVLGALFLFFALDGINSLFSTPLGSFLYAPANWLRLLTGVGLGWGMAAMLIPAFHQLVWKESIPEPILATFTQVLILVGLDLLPVVAIVFGINFLLYPIGILTTLTVPVLLSTIYAMLLIMLTYRENTFTSYRQLVPWALAGGMIAMLQIFIFDIVRFNLTGTWAGFPL